MLMNLKSFLKIAISENYRVSVYDDIHFVESVEFSVKNWTDSYIYLTTKYGQYVVDGVYVKGSVLQITVVKNTEE